MSSDELIWSECIGKERVDWYDLAARLGVTPDQAMKRALDIGAWWLKDLVPERVSRAELLFQSGAPVSAIANVLGTDIHTALIWLGMRQIRGRG